MQKNVLCVSSVLDASGAWRERKGERKRRKARSEVRKKRVGGVGKEGRKEERDGRRQDVLLG